MAYLMTKTQFDSLNASEKNDIKLAIEQLHSTHIWVSITLKNPPKGILISRVHSTSGYDSHQMSEYVRVDSRIVKQSIEVTKIKAWLVGE